jgi:hypothetical protein
MVRSLAQPREAPTASLRFGRSGQSGDEPAFQLGRLTQARQGGGAPQEAAARIPHARFIEFPELGHSPQIYAPEVFRKVLDWLRENPAEAKRISAISVVLRKRTLRHPNQSRRRARPPVPVLDLS